MFYTDFKYTSRENKPEYGWRKYSNILTGKILDVGADECGLKRFLSDDAEYVGIGLGGSCDIKIDLERQKLPFEDNHFDCVLCLDVLEHLDNIYDVFDELCRVTKKYLVVSLPNPWDGFMQMLRKGYYDKQSGTSLKYYNLPPTPPLDRHKWFYSAREAIEFIEKRGNKNSMKVIQVDRENMPLNLKKRLLLLLLKGFLHKDVDVNSLFGGSIWAVLKKF